MSPGRRVEMVDPTHARLSIVRQCRLVSVARSSFYGVGARKQVFVAALAIVTAEGA